MFKLNTALLNPNDYHQMNITLLSFPFFAQSIVYLSINLPEFHQQSVIDHSPECGMM